MTQRVAAEDLVERDRELTALEGLVGATVAGRGGIALIEGPAGIGKSGLLTAVRAAAADEGVRVLVARASELERDFPFGIIRQLFDAPLADPAVRERWLSGAASAATAVFGTAGEEGGADASFSSLHGLHWLTVNAAADGPLLLAVDDLQWSDRASLRFLAYLARRREGMPVLVVATLRSGEAGTDTALVEEFAGDPDSVVVRPGPLSAAAVADLVRARLGDDADDGFCAACHEATAGNPLLLRQLLTALKDDGVRPDAAHIGVVRDTGPRAASRGVLVRLARLPTGAIPVARAVAVLGESATLPAVAALVETDEASAAASIADLARAEILRHEPPLGFVHPLVREAVRREIAPGELELAHGRAAELLIAAGADDDRIAAHLLHVPCRGEDWVVARLTGAARAAVRRGAPDSAVAYFRRALAEPAGDEERPVLLFELGLTAWIMAGPEAIPVLQEAYVAQTDPLRRALAGFGLARTYLFSDAPAKCRPIVADVLAELPPELEDLGRALRAVDAVALNLGGAGDPDPGRLAEYRDVGAGAGLGAQMLGSMALLDAVLAAEPADACVAQARALLQDGTLIAGDPGLFVVTPIMTLVAGDTGEADAVWDAFEANAHRNGSVFGVLTLNVWRGLTSALTGELAQAEESLREALHQSVLWGLGSSGSLAYGHSFLARVLVERGDVAGARAVLPAQVRDDDGADAANVSRSAHAEVLLAEGRADDVLALTDTMARQTRLRHPVYNPWHGLRARALHALGQTEEAVAIARDGLAVAEGWGTPNIVGPALRLLGELEGEEGVARLQEACELLEHSTARLEHAKALAALGGALRQARRPSDARDPLRRALELADRCGASGLAERTRSDLYATGARPRTTALGGVESLTARERRVADLAAEGATNREIAQALFVTPKTVEVHLGNAYRKLDIRSRRELAAALGTA